MIVLDAPHITRTGPEVVLEERVRTEGAPITTPIKKRISRAKPAPKGTQSDAAEIVLAEPKETTSDIKEDQAVSPEAVEETGARLQPSSQYVSDRLRSHINDLRSVVASLKSAETVEEATLLRDVFMARTNLYADRFQEASQVQDAIQALTLIRTVLSNFREGQIPNRVQLGHIDRLLGVCLPSVDGRPVFSNVANDIARARLPVLPRLGEEEIAVILNDESQPAERSEPSAQATEEPPRDTNETSTNLDLEE